MNENQSARELLPCPFCGDAPRITGVYFDCDDLMPRLKIICDVCDVSQQSSMTHRDFLSMGKEEAERHLIHHAAKEWNLRTTPPTQSQAGTETPVTDEELLTLAGRIYWAQEHGDNRDSIKILRNLILEQTYAAQRENARLAGEVAGLKVDKERLDWLEKDGNIDKTHCDAMSGSGVFFVDNYESQIGIRAAIDAARAATEERKKS